MTRGTEERLKVSLTAVIDTWMGNADGLPTVGDDTAEIMATAALAVLRGIADTQQYLADNDMLAES